MADTNILQGAIFHEDALEDSKEIGNESDQAEDPKRDVENLRKPLETNLKLLKNKFKPAAHRVATLATLAILRVFAAFSSSKENDKVQVKCITFSQAPVGNSASLYVNRKAWQHYFKTYCIPEDLVPRILSPAYFHHYNAQPLSTGTFDTRTTTLQMSSRSDGAEKSRAKKAKENEGEQLVLGLCPVENSFWRLSRLVPLEGVRRHFNKYKGQKVDPVETLPVVDSTVTSIIDDVVVASTPQSLEIQEGSEVISLKPFTNTNKRPQDAETTEKLAGKSNTSLGVSMAWRRVPYLASYVPFGQAFITKEI